MKITKEILAGKILALLNRKTTPEMIANWAETAMIDSEYQEGYETVISEALAKIGLINVVGFKLPIAFYLNTLAQLGYHAIFGLEPTAQSESEFTYV